MAPRKPRQKPTPRVPDVHVHLPPDPPDDGGPDDEGTDDDSAITEAEQSVRSMTSDIDNRVVVKLYRRHPSLGNRRAFLAEMDPDDYSQDAVQEAYGGGRYTAEFFGPTRGKAGKPGRGPIRTVQFEVDLAIPPKSPNAIRGTDTPAPNAGPVSSSRIDALMESGVLTLFQQMQRANELQALAVQRMIEGGGRSSVDWTAILAAASPIVVALLESMMNRPDPMKAAREIAELATTKRNPMEDFQQLLETMRVMREMSGGNGEPDPDTPPWLRVLERTAGPLLARAMQHDRLAETNPPDVHSAGSRPVPSMDATTEHGPTHFQPSLPNPANMAAHPELQLIAPMVPSIANWASAGRSPEWAAETILYDIPAGYHAAVADRLQNPAFIANLTTVFDVLAPFGQWLEAFRVAVLAQLADDGDDTTGG